MWFLNTTYHGPGVHVSPPPLFKVAMTMTFHTTRRANSDTLTNKPQYNLVLCSTVTINDNMKIMEKATTGK
jgi:hypothetical protein